MQEDSMNRRPDREEIALRLRKLAESPSPSELDMGAMCYDMAEPPDRIDYVCPVCGEKTLYSFESDERIADMFMLQFELNECRRITHNLIGLDAELDETEFCMRCRPEVTEPVLVLKVRYPEGGDAVETRGVSKSDLQLLRAFIKGSDRIAGDTGRESPLQDHMKRLRELLGIPV